MVEFMQCEGGTRALFGDVADLPSSGKIVVDGETVTIVALQPLGCPAGKTMARIAEQPPSAFEVGLMNHPDDPDYDPDQDDEEYVANWGY